MSGPAAPDAGEEASARLTRMFAPADGAGGFKGLVGFLGRMGWLQKRLLAPALVAAAGLSLIVLAPPALLAHLIDRTFPARDVAMVAAVGAALCCLAVMDAGLAFTRRLLSATAGLAVRRDILVPAFAAMLRLPVEGSHGRDQGALGQTFEDVERLARGASEDTIEIALGLGTVAVLSVAMLAVDPLLAGIVLVLVGLLAAVHVVAARALRAREAAWFDTRSRYWSHLVEAIAYVDTVRLNSAHHFAEQRFVERLDDDIRANRRVVLLSAALDAAGRLTGGLVIAAIAWLGGLAVVEGRQSIGDFVLFVSIAGSLSSPVLGLVKALDDLQAMMISRAKLAQLARAPRETIASRAVAPSRASQPAALSARAVSFAFPGRAVLEQLSFEISPGERIAITGASGIGKSTLASLLFRDRTPSAGALALDDADLTTLPLDAVRGRIAWVPHQVDVFSGSIDANIAIGRPDTVAADRTRAATIAALDADIRALPHGYDTLVGQGGMELSAGQRQRLGIARAILAQPDLLILDESTSSLDLATERMVIDALLRHLPDTTIIAITHRASVVERMDRSIDLSAAGA